MLISKVSWCRIRICFFSQLKRQSVFCFLFFLNFWSALNFFDMGHSKSFAKLIRLIWHAQMQGKHCQMRSDIKFSYVVFVRLWHMLIKSILLLQKMAPYCQACHTDVHVTSQQPAPGSEKVRWSNNGSKLKFRAVRKPRWLLVFSQLPFFTHHRAFNMTQIISKHWCRDVYNIATTVH